MLLCIQDSIFSLEVISKPIETVQDCDNIQEFIATQVRKTSLELMKTHQL